MKNDILKGSYQRYHVRTLIDLTLNQVKDKQLDLIY